MSWLALLKNLIINTKRLINMQLSSRHFQSLWLIIAVFYLSGCASKSTKPTQPSNNINVKPSVLHKQHMAKISAIRDFSLKGRLGVTKQPKSFSARLAWQHTSTKDNVDIYTPLGGKAANIRKTKDQVTLTDSKKKTISADNIEALTQKALGFGLPLTGLNDWALGRPSKSLVNAMTWDKDGRISTLQQGGWDIQYKDYQDREGYFLPRKVTLKNPNVSLKLIVDKWSESLTIK